MSGGDTLDHMLSCVADIPGKINYGVLFSMEVIMFLSSAFRCI